ncbi:MAG: hypothetical protein IK006_09120 [Bacteroidaceae bacterium]|nr:hypothetical protein [Bacteroidaceae bacterium]
MIYYGEVKDFTYNEDNFSLVIDLGLSVKWASLNIGASYPWEYGDYFAWGETEAKSSYTFTNYKFNISGDSWDNVKYSKYNTSSSYGTVDNKITLDPEDDVAQVKWGYDWRMPTKAELEELLNNCTWTWTIVNGVNGFNVTSNKSGYTNRSIFLPAAGDGNHIKKGDYCCYWSSSLSQDMSRPIPAADCLLGRWLDVCVREIGQSVRPVCPLGLSE